MSYRARTEARTAKAGRIEGEQAAQKLAIAVSVTLNEKASLSGNLSTNVLKEIAAYLAPEAPFGR